MFVLLLPFDLVSGCEGEHDTTFAGGEISIIVGELEKVRAGVVGIDAVFGGVASILRTQGVSGSGGVALPDA